MKKQTIAFSALVLFAASFAACKKKDTVTLDAKMEITGKRTEFKFGNIIDPGEYFVAFAGDRLNLDSLVKTVNPAYNINNIKSIYLKSCNWNMENKHPGYSLGAFSQVKMQVFIPTLELVGWSNFPDDMYTNSISIDGDDTKSITAAFVNDSIAYRFVGVIRKPIGLMECTVDFTYSISIADK